MEDIITSTPYDDAFRTMYVECDELVLPLLNEIFHTNYHTGDKIVRLGNEHFDHRQGGAEDKRITDAFLKVIGKDRQNFHMECESGTDGSIVVRMFQYGSQLALVDSRIEDGMLQVEFPNAAVLYLRTGRNTPDVIRIEIHTPGGSVSYTIPTIKMSSYTLEEIFEKDLYFLIPFYIFNLEKELEDFDEDPLRLEELKGIYVDIQKRLEERVVAHQLQSVSYGVIRDLSNRVVQNLAWKYQNIRKGVNDIMGGQVLDLEVLRIRDEGRAEGWNEGRNEGRNEERSMLVKAIQLLKAGKTEQEILDAGIDQETIEVAKVCV